MSIQISSASNTITGAATAEAQAATLSNGPVPNVTLAPAATATSATPVTLGTATPASGLDGDSLAVTLTSDAVFGIAGTSRLVLAKGTLIYTPGVITAALDGTNDTIRYAVTDRMTGTSVIESQNVALSSPTLTKLSSLWPVGVGLAVDANGNLFGVLSYTIMNVAPTRTINSDYQALFELAKTSGGYATTPTILVSLETGGSNGIFSWGGVDGFSAPNLVIDTEGHVIYATYSYQGGTVVNASTTPIILDGATPSLSRITDPNGDLFGTTSAGTVFEIIRSASGYASSLTTVANFEGTRPSANLTIDANGDLFGINGNTVYEIAKTADGYASVPTTLVSFDPALGLSPAWYSAPVLASDVNGNLFGTTQSGGTSGLGTVYEIVKTASGYASTPTTLASFNGTNGSQPSTGVVVDPNGNLFGTTPTGGTSGDGTVFEIAKTANGYASTPATLVNTGSSIGLTADANGDLFFTTYGKPGRSNVGVYEITNSGFAPPKTITGTAEGLVTTDIAAPSPFWDVVIADPNTEQTEAVTVTLSAPANGLLMAPDAASYNANTATYSFSSGTYNVSSGIYTVTGSAADVTSALHSLTFVPTVHQVASGGTVTTGFTIQVSDTIGYSASDSTTSVVATASGGPASSAGVSALYQTFMQIALAPDQASSVAVQINNGTQTAAQYEASLFGSPAALSSMLPSLIATDAFYGVTPSSSVLASVGATVQGWSSLGLSTLDQWNLLGLQFAHNGTFGALYDALDNSTFVADVYTTIFGHTPAAPLRDVLASDITSLAWIYRGYDSAHSDTLGGKGALFGTLLYWGEVSQLGSYYTGANTFLTNLANTALSSGAVPTYGQGAELRSRFPNGIAAPPIAAEISARTIDPAASSQTMRFLAGAANDTLMLNNGATDALNVGALLTTESVITPTDFPPFASQPVAIQSSDALQASQPTGQTSAAPVLQDFVYSATSTHDMIRQNAQVIYQ